MPSSSTPRITRRDATTSHVGELLGRFQLPALGDVADAPRDEEDLVETPAKKKTRRGGRRGVLLVWAVAIASGTSWRHVSYVQARTFHAARLRARKKHRGISARQLRVRRCGISAGAACQLEALERAS